MSATSPLVDAPLPEAWLGMRRPALLVGAAAAATCVAGLLSDTDQVYRSWLVAAVFWSGPSLGCLALWLLHRLTGGEWGRAARRPLEAGARTLPVVGLLFVPLAFGLPSVYAWARPDAVAADEVLRHKAAWSNAPGFVVRSAACFFLWSGTALAMSRLSARRDRGDERAAAMMGRLAGPALGLYVLTATCAGVDWLMSLEPHWQSSSYGLEFVCGHVLSGVALVVVVASGLSRAEAFREVVRPAHFRDWGKLMLAFVMLWAYLSYSQFLLIWSADLPAEVAWYVHRSGLGWSAVAIALALLHFAVPFLLLLSRRLKRNPRRLAAVAVLVLAMRWVDVFWQAAPTFHEGSFHLHWLDLAATLAVGGPWLAAFVTFLDRRPLIPLGPRGREVADAR